MPFAPPPPEPVSYHREVAKLFAFHCNGCHGEAAGLNLRDYKGAMAGGNKGKIIIAGDAENSLLIHFVDGRRGEAHRMPAGGAPLSQPQLATLRQWIAEGAREDAAPPPRRYERTNVSMVPGKVTRIACRVPVQAYIVVTATDPATSKTLWSEVASIKTPKEQNDAGQPGGRLQWDLRPAPGWPPTVTIGLTVEHAAAGPKDVELDISFLEP